MVGNNSLYGLQWLETAADCYKVREDVARLIYLYLGISLLRKQAFPHLLKGSLVYVFSGLLINMQFVKRFCGENVSSIRNFLCTAGK